MPPRRLIIPNGHQRGIWTAFFPIHGNPSSQHIRRQAINELAHMIPDTVQIIGPWKFTELTGVDHRRWLLAEAPAIGPTDNTGRRRAATFITPSLPTHAIHMHPDRDTPTAAA